METSIIELVNGLGDNYILPFLWMRGEEESLIRAEIDAIDSCGIKAVCLEARPHPEYAGDLWWRDVDIVVDEAKKRGMKIWILDDAHFPTGMANGLLKSKYPERAKQYMNQHTYDIAGPVSYITLDVNKAMERTRSFLDFGKTVQPPLVDEKELLSVMAYPLIEDMVMGDQGINLMEYVQDGVLTYSFPEGVWRVFVCYTTYEEGGKPEYVNLIDEDSVKVLIEAVYEPHFQRYADLFGTIFAGFFSDEPGFGNTGGFAMDEKIGRKNMPLPWNKDVPRLLEERLGADWAEYLPMLFYPTVTDVVCQDVRFVYMDIITRLYEKNFAGQLGEWCQAHNVEYIGHVIEDKNQHARLGCGPGHFFRAMKGQHMAGIDDIGNCLIPGQPDNMRIAITGPSSGKFYHYILGKMGASSALFDPVKKGRLLCELYGAYGWDLGVKDMKWITDKLLVQGVNYLTPHAFSMAEYPDPVCPPHFNARGNNAQLAYFGKLMFYANRMCHLFNGGQWVPEIAILYHGEQEWTNDCMFMEEPAKVLSNNQLDYAIIPMDALTDMDVYNTKVENERLTVNGAELKVIIVPQTKYVDSRLVEFMEKYPEVNFVFVDSKPEAIINAKGDQHTGLDIINQYPVSKLRELADDLLRCGIRGLEIDKSFRDLTFRHYRKESDIYMIFNESLSETFSGKVKMKMCGPIVKYDAMKNTIEMVEDAELYENGFCEVALTLRPYESVVLFANDMIEDTVLQMLLTESVRPGADPTVMDISEGWKLSMRRALETEPSEVELMEKLEPVSVKHPRFSGFMTYEKNVEVKAVSGAAILKVEQVGEVATVRVNGQEADFRICPPYEFDLSGFLREGENHIQVEVVNTPARDVLTRKPGIFGHDGGFYSASGMYGKVTLEIG